MWKVLLAIAGLVFAAIVGVIVAGVWTLSQGLPEVMALETYRPATSTVIFSADSVPLGEIAAERRNPVSLESMPPILIQAVLAIEDHRYFEHIGINFGRILKAAWVDISTGQLKQGGSTITQQLAKLLFLSPERSIKRKLREALLAVEIEKTYTKKEILYFYLNQIYLGNGAYGVAAASKVYFGKEVGKLTLPECAMLAALPKNPGGYNPFRNPSAAKERRDIVIDRMLELEWVTREEAELARNTPLPTNPEGRSPHIAPYFVEAVRQELVEVLGADEAYKGGLRVYTTLDSKLQRAAEEALLKGVAEVTKRHTSNPARLQGAFVGIDVATGAVVVHSGGVEWAASKFDRSWQSERQMGSVFKPFTYIAALEAGMSQSDTVVDSPISFRGAAGKAWSPMNYDREYKGRMTLRKALAESRNIPAIRVFDRVGKDAVEAVTRRMGLPKAMGQGLASALGVGSSNLYELTSAYASLPAGGMRPTPYRIRAVYTRDGQNIWRFPPAPRRVLPPEVAFVAADMLKAVVEIGTARKAQELGFQVAGKTGTTDDQRDAAFIGFSSKLALGVWMGRDNNTPIGHGETGGHAALPVWIEIMKAATSRGPLPPPWEPPPGVVFKRIEVGTGRETSSSGPGTANAAFIERKVESVQSAETQ